MSGFVGLRGVGGDRTATQTAEESARGDASPALRAVIALVVVATTSAVGWVATTGDFVLDDFSLFALARSYSAPNIDYLSTSWFGHVMPAGLLVMWFESRVFGLDKTWFGLTQAVGMLVTMMLLAGLLRRMTPGWTSVIPLTFFGTSMAVVAAAGWWANAMWVIPVMVITLLSMRCLLAARSSEAVNRATYWCIGCLVAGLAFSEKAALIPFGLFVFDVARRRDSLWASVRATWTVWRRLWLISALVLVAFIGFYRVSNGANPLGHSPFGVQPDSPWDFVARVWSRGLPAGLFGGPLEWLNVLLAAPTPAFVTYAGVLLIVVAALCVITAPGRRALAWAVIYLSGTAYLMAAGRFVGADGMLTLMQVRYYADSVLWLTIALALSLGAVSRRAWFGGGTVRRIAFYVAAVWILVTGALWSRSVVGLVDAYRADASEPIPADIRQTLAAYRSLPADTRVLDTPLRYAPFLVITDNTGRVLRQSDFYGQLVDRPIFVDGSDDPVLYRGDGKFAATEAVGHVAEPEPPVCLTPQNPTGTITLPAPLFPNFHQVDAATDADAPASVEVTLDGEPGGRIEAPAGPSRTSTWVEGGSADVHLTLRSGGPVCVNKIEVGPPRETEVLQTAP